TIFKSYNQTFKFLYNFNPERLFVQIYTSHQDIFLFENTDSVAASIRHHQQFVPGVVVEICIVIYLCRMLESQPEVVILQVLVIFLQSAHQTHSHQVKSDSPPDHEGVFQKGENVPVVVSKSNFIYFGQIFYHINSVKIEGVNEIDAVV